MLHKTVVTYLDELRVNYSWYNEGTIYPVNEWMGAKGMAFECGHMNIAIELTTDGT